MGTRSGLVKVRRGWGRVSWEAGSWLPGEPCGPLAHPGVGQDCTLLSSTEPSRSPGGGDWVTLEVCRRWEETGYSLAPLAMPMVQTTWPPSSSGACLLVPPTLGVLPVHLLGDMGLWCPRPRCGSLQPSLHATVTREKSSHPGGILLLQPSGPWPIEMSRH